MLVAEGFSFVQAVKNLFQTAFWSLPVVFIALIPPAIAAVLLIRLLSEGAKAGSGLPEKPVKLTFISKVLIFIGAFVASRVISGVLLLIIVLIVYFKCRKTEDNRNE